jgi:phospholipase/carboxylesterase
MKLVKLGPLDVRLAGGSDREGGGTGPLVVLFHGYGAPGDDIAGLYRGLDVDRAIRFAFPAAPHLLQGGFDFSAFGMGAPRAWWHIDIAALEEALATGQHRDLTRSIPEGLPEARAMACETLDALEKALGPSHVILGGFSQGAMLATSITLETDRKVDGLVAFSGTYLAEDTWKPLMSKRAGLRAVVTHGTHDPLLPFPLAQKLASDLTEAGVRANFVPFRGQHQIPPVALGAFEALVREVSAG